MGNIVDQATETQLKNIQRKTGKSLNELSAIVQASGLSKHSEIRAMLQRDLGLGYGDANTLTHILLKQLSGAGEKPGEPSADDVLAGIYTGPRAGLRPIHERLLEVINHFGEFETAPKKGYVSLRRRKQFAMIGPATHTQVEVGINYKTLPQNPRLKPLPAGSMCSYTVRLAQADEVDDELAAWLKLAYESAG